MTIPQELNRKMLEVLDEIYVARWTLLEADIAVSNAKLLRFVRVPLLKCFYLTGSEVGPPS